jgi:H+-translocating NAD(P) transhydrogenase subunit alpha
MSVSPSMSVSMVPLRSQEASAYDVPPRGIPLIACLLGLACLFSPSAALGWDSASLELQSKEVKLQEGTDGGPTAPQPSDESVSGDVASNSEGAKSAGTWIPTDRLSVLVASLTVFVLAIFIGFEVINKVPPTLHTPLMSGSNAISGITVVGAILAAGMGRFGLGTILGTAAVVLATINVAGGFWVTHRMLAMFKKK